MKAHAVKFLASVSELSSSEVANQIGQYRYDAIKRKDDHPMFVALKVGYEGVSSGTLTIGNQTRKTEKRWHRATIEELADRMNFGGPGLFAGNHADREKPDRPRHGDVMAGYVRDNPRGEAEAIGIAYVKDPDTREKVSSGQYDVCSVEGDVVIGGIDSDEPYVDAVHSISGVVLACSADETPGFAGAGVEAVIAELTSHGGIGEMADKTTGNPSDTYTRNQLAADPTVQELIREGRKTEYEDYRTEKKRADDLEDKVKELEKTNKQLEADLKNVGVSKNAGRVTKELDDQIGKLKLTKQEKELIRTRLASKVAVDDEGASDDDIKEAVKKEVDAEKDYAMQMRKIYGTPKNTDKPDKKDDDSDDDATDKTEDDDGTDDDDDNDDGGVDPFLKDNPLAKEDE